ncbi:MAG: hypothetical protein WDZ73_00945 [Candidatus Paceibacterota bacterium]
MFNQFKIYLYALFSSIFVLGLEAERVSAATIGGDGIFKVQNPLGVETLGEFVEVILQALVQLGVPVVALGIIYSGFLFVKAQGKPEDIKTAREAFFWTIVGAAIVLGAFVILNLIQSTVATLQ